MKIPSDILRIYQALHTWAGIVAGLLLFIGFFAGALTLFKQPLDRWSSAPTNRLPWISGAALDYLVPAILAEHPAARQEFSLHMREQENIVAPMAWVEPAQGGQPREWRASMTPLGEVVATVVQPSQLGELIDQLHRTAGIPGIWQGEYLGIYVMGVAGVLYFLALVSGLILLLPTMVKDFFALRRGHNRKRFWLDAHNLIGITQFPFHVVISLTVIVFAFHDWFYDGLALAVYGDQPMFQAPKVAPQSYGIDKLLPVSRLVERVQEEAPGFAITELLFMDLDNPRPRLRASVHNPAFIEQGPYSAYLVIQPYTGEVLDASMLPGREDVWSGLTSTFFALHFGSYGGDLVRWVYFVLGLCGAFLFYSGNLLWLESRRKKARGLNRAVQLSSCRWLAAVTIGVCFGSVAGVTCALLASKWLHQWKPLNSAYVAVYYSVFIAMMAWACWRGAARAAPQLLRVCALTLVAIPFSSVIALLLPGLGMWVHTSAGALAVDFTALVLAMIFVRASILARKRALTGPVDSIWSYAS